MPVLTNWLHAQDRTSADTWLLRPAWYLIAWVSLAGVVLCLAALAVQGWYVHNKLASLNMAISRLHTEASGYTQSSRLRKAYLNATRPVGLARAMDSIDHSIARVDGSLVRLEGIDEHSFRIEARLSAEQLYNWLKDTSWHQQVFIRELGLSSLDARQLDLRAELSRIE